MSGQYAGLQCPWFIKTVVANEKRSPIYHFTLYANVMNDVPIRFKKI